MENILSKLEERKNNSSAKYQGQIQNLKRMEEESVATFDKAAVILKELIPGLAKMGFLVGPNIGITPVQEDKANTSKCLSLDLLPSEKFRFITFNGYTSGGVDKNRAALNEKAGKLAAKMLPISGWVTKVSINPSSLEVKNKGEHKMIHSVSFYFDI